MKKLDFDTADELFHYDESTGRLYWKISRSNCIKPGQSADAITAEGYRRVYCVPTYYYAHKIVWLLNTGIYPKTIDHINGDRSDNRMENLREVNRTQNNRNACIRLDSSSGFTGVNFDKRSNKWTARISNKRNRIHLGRFSSKQKAIEARKKANIEYGYHPNHGKSPIGSRQE